MSGSYAALDHPADLLLEIRGDDLPALFEHALYAFYSQVADVADVMPREELVLEVTETSVEGALRALLNEALFHLETEGFLAAGARVSITQEQVWRVCARLQGETADRQRHQLLLEVKAITYHRLTATQSRDGHWQATVLLDV